MNEQDKRIQINVDFTDTPDLFVALDEMAAKDYLKRTPFLKQLIRREWDRRLKMAETAAKRSNDKRQSARPTA